MPPKTKPDPIKRLKTFIFGRSIDPSNTQAFHGLSLVAFFAWVGLGADGLSSSSYGPEEAFMALGHHYPLAILVGLGSVLTVFLISASYSQVIELFPNGGGGYMVASKLLNPYCGMVSGCALVIDYVLTITISISSGADAIFSFVPVEYHGYRLHFAILMLGILTVMNMRGVKESVLPLVPVFLIFIFCHFFVIVYAVITHLMDIQPLITETTQDFKGSLTELGWAGTALLLLRAYSMGAGTYTGIEAVSTGMPLLREPRVKTGKRTMLYMAASLSFMVIGLMLAYVLYKVSHVPGKTLNAVLFETITSTWNPTLGQGFVWVILFSEAAILFVAAQAGFLGGPRMLANMALDQWFPNRFTLLSDRMVSQNGIMLMAGAAGVVLLLTGGSVKLLVVLYSITVFIDFVMSQLGMVRHWVKNRKRLKHWRRSLTVNAAGLVLCVFILIMVTVLKFNDGGWITLLVLMAIVGVALLTRRHYRNVHKTLHKMDSLVQAAQSSQGAVTRIMTGDAEVEKEVEPEPPQFDPKAKTAVVLVNGFNGLGLQTLFSIIRLFGGIYRNFVFVEVALIDAGNFKGSDEIENLQGHVKGELDKYVDFIQKHGYYGEALSVLSHDVVEGSATLAPTIMEKFPHSVFFMGQLVFAEETFIDRIFHNTTVFAVQRRLYHLGIPFIIMPIRVKVRV
jgi:amino acid transporter